MYMKLFICHPEIYYNLAILNSIPFFSDDNPAAFLLLTRSNVSTISKDNKDTISRLYALRDTTKVKKNAKVNL